MKSPKTIFRNEFVISLALACLLVGAGVIALFLMQGTSRVVTAPAFDGFLIDPAMFGGVDDLLYLESKICEVHHVAMQPTVIPLAYGLLVDVADGSLREEEEARKGRFPHFRGYFWGGCAGDTRWHSTRIYICPACEQAWREWDSHRKVRQLRKASIAGSGIYHGNGYQK